MSEGERGREKRCCVEYIKEQGVREEEREGKRNRGRGSRKEDESKKDFELDSRHWSNRERLYNSQGDSSGPDVSLEPRPGVLA